MSKKLCLFGGALLSGLSLWWLVSSNTKTKVKKELYGAMQRAALSIVSKLLLKPWVKKMMRLLYN
ncbi:MAG: hypothetical protein V3581_01595 [Candidatus Cardinium sp.]|uniref:hypothetical protein n=1 Tax=Candidatus Cardinium sp. TP TaxID=2961955 RepID=UPI0021AF9424|nr:hypothetical protein [Candidatus Cardinium sp. TP]MCT4697492.1 hypothetical protein [Candidatus Cardinium sp. TP]MDN5247411.1 hypothetical protein [Candidatus Cardinium sp.]